MTIQFSEFRSREPLRILKNKLVWVWIYTFYKFLISYKNIKLLNNFKNCIVGFELWTEKNAKHKKLIKNNSYKIYTDMRLDNTLIYGKINFLNCKIYIL